MKFLLTVSIVILAGRVAITACNEKGFHTTDSVVWNTVYEVPTVSDEISIDGKPDEAIWSSATPIDKYFSSQNAEPVAVDANIRVLFDGRNLVFGVQIPKINSSTGLKKCYLSDEFDLRNVPNISIFLDPKHDHGVYYRFIIDSNGNKQDLRVDDESWRTEWTAEVYEADGKLNAEIKILVSGLTEKITNGGLWGFNVTLDGVSDSGTLSATPVKHRLADANYLGHLLFKGNLNKTQLSQIKKSMPVLHEKQDQAKLVANKVLCGPDLVEMEGELNIGIVGIEMILKNGTKIKCIGLDNDEVIRSNYHFLYEKYENEQLQRLRNQYNLEEIAEAGKNDFEKLLLLNEWLYKHVTFGSPPPVRPDALQVLYHGLNGQTYYCTYLSFTLMQMYASLGYTARKITSAGHGTLDVWSDYWRKWIQIDPSRHSYYRLKGNAVPLNSNEIRREYWKNGGTDMEMVFGTEQRAERVTLEIRDKDGLMRYRPDSYAWVAYKSRNNFFEVPFAYWNYDYLIVEDEYNADKSWTNRNKTDMREILGTRTKRIGDVFWTLNQAHIHLYDEGSNQLKVQLETVTPNFETFEYAVDQGDWKKSGAIFKWELHSGQNFLYARSVNKFGTKGTEHKIVLNVN